MGWKRWMAGFLGFGNHESNHNDNHIHNDSNNNSDIDHHQQQEEELEEEEINHNYNNNSSNYIKSNRKGFSVPVQQIGPVFLPCHPGDGGVQRIEDAKSKMRNVLTGCQRDVAYELLYDNNCYIRKLDNEVVCRILNNGKTDLQLQTNGVVAFMKKKGLGWYTKRLRVDEDGDVADEFFDEVSAETSSSTEAHHKHYPKFEVKVNTKSAKARNPVLSREGTIQQVVEYRGRVLLV